VRGEIAMGEARAAARDAGHAAATAHVASHAAHAANYALTAAIDAAVPTDSVAATAKERDWQYRRLPRHLRPVAFPARGNN
jgi:type VI protein secretion system component VasF